MQLFTNYFGGTGVIFGCILVCWPNSNLVYFYHSMLCYTLYAIIVCMSVWCGCSIPAGADPENEFGGGQLSKSHLFYPLSLIFLPPGPHTFSRIESGHNLTRTLLYITVPKRPIKIKTSNHKEIRLGTKTDLIVYNSFSHYRDAQNVQKVQR